MADDRQDGHETLNPAALGAADVARLLGVPVAVVEQHLAEGAPHAADGSVNLVHYAAWLNRELAARAGGVEAADLSADARAMADKSAEAKRGADGD